MARYREFDLLEGELLPPERAIARPAEGLVSRPEAEPFVSYYRRRTEELEREDASFSRARAQLAGIEKTRQLLQLEGSVSSGKLEELESFADRLIRENVAKQAQPEIVARNVKRIYKMAGVDPPSATRPKRFATAFAPGRRVDLVPRTVFGTEAWTRSGYAVRKKFITKVLALPCVERSVRREVLFAKKKGGHGHRVPHRGGKFSDIWC